VAAARRIVCTCLTTLGAILVLSLGGGVWSVGAALAGTKDVDGISDQSIPLWDGGFQGSYFAGLFRDVWGAHSHITLARYVVQWNAMSGDYPRYRSEFEAWLADVASLDLKPEVALTSYDGIYPASPGEYRLQLQQILDRARALGHPIDYLEAWNEPNNQGSEPAATAARFTNAASATCAQEYDCTVVAGNFEDSANVAVYEREYIDNLDPVPTIWGVHPYNSVEEQSEAPFLNFREHLPDGGAGERIWFTEVTARRCSDFAGRLVENGELGQARRARWLVDTLMRNAQPEHVFYYEFLLEEHRRPSCQTEGSDGALYLPTDDPAEPDRPRLAASYIWDGESEPLGYLDGAFMANPAQQALTGAVGL
jgi:hypothetical protein